MKPIFSVVASLLIAAFAGAGFVKANEPSNPITEQTISADAQAATLSVENMTCPLCPITVRSAMSRVDGVQAVEVDAKANTAHVVFDPNVTTLQMIADASTHAGFPAQTKDSNDAH